ncbi:sugar transferase [Variovorax sp. dw_954]|uniref:sugar transferase n=1 Tax=Variovorax sp. dw_954 TaxID=2720078 RepID=UPI001BD43540|nr:sugar transferase [Variovorax sp. dw_954]
MMYQIFKRIFDLLASLIVVALMFPLVVASALAIKLTSSGPVFFLQERVGLHGRRFSIYKLRTMTVGNNSRDRQIRPGDVDVTRVGGILRRLKIDELPQVLNVLVGDMSLVGPRPCLVRTYESMPDWAKTRFDVRPGMTGLAQINGNTAISWEHRWKYDVEYAAKASMPLDCLIILKTIAVVLIGEERFGVAE